MKYNVIGYFLSEGFRNVFKNKKSTFSCLGVMCATMLMFGLFFVIGQNINNAIKDLEKEQGMQVFMYPEATDEQIAKLKEDLGKIEGINTIEFVSKEEGYNTMKKRLGDNAKALDGFTPDFFEVSYIITLTDLSLNNQVYEAISKLDNVTIYNPYASTGIITFNINGVFAQDAATYLGSKGVFVRSGQHCAKILMDFLKTSATVRASTYFYNDEEDIKRLVGACKNGGNFLDAYFI